MKNLSILATPLLLGVALSMIQTPKPLFQGTQNKIPVSSVWDSSIKAPYETNAFFENLVVDSGHLPIDMIPYLVRIERGSKGIGISANTRNVIDKWNVTTNFDLDWAITPQTGKFDTQKVIKHDKLSVTLKGTFQTGQMAFPLVRGSAYLSILVNDLAPIYYTPRGIENVVDGNGNQVTKFGTSDKFVITLKNGSVWVLYVSHSVKILRTPVQIRFQTHVKGNIRFAYIGKDQSKLPIYDKYKDAIPMSGQIKYTITGAQALIKFIYSTLSFSGAASTGNPLIFALTHHLDVLVNPTKEDLQFYTIKGNITAIGDASWLMREQLTTITWQDPVHPKKQQWKDATRKALLDDTKYYTDPARQAEIPVYRFGVQVMRLARLALIADYLSEKQSGIDNRAAIKRLIEPWLDGTNSNKLLYDSVYGGIITDLHVKGKIENAINNRYDNHHHDYGYLLYAAAVVGKDDAAFLTKYKDKLLELVRDYANPSPSDPYFPMTRHKDWYSGHSWSGGLAQYDDNRNEQSVSEALNSYYALILLGEALNDPQLKDWGRLLAATEMRAAKRYWQMPDATVYPEVFAQNRMVGDLWSTKADYRTWFGGSVEYIHGIHMIPFTPLTYDLLSYSYVQKEYPVFAKAKASGEYLSYQIMAQAILDPDAAWARATSESISDFGRNSRANMLWWIISREVPQIPDLGGLTGGIGLHQNITLPSNDTNTNPTNPTNPTKPTSPTNTTNPTNPTNPSNPTDNENSGDEDQENKPKGEEDEDKDENNKEWEEDQDWKKDREMQKKAQEEWDKMMEKIKKKQEAEEKAEQEENKKAEEEAKRREEEEAKRKAEEKAKRIAEREARRKAAEEARKKRQEEAAKRRAAQEAQRRNDEDDDEERERGRRQNDHDNDDNDWSLRGRAHLHLHTRPLRLHGRHHHGRHHGHHHGRHHHGHHHGRHHGRHRPHRHHHHHHHHHHRDW